MKGVQMPRFHKFDIARSQLETAVHIFLNQRNFSSVITLAGAASGILDELVRRAGKEPFVDYARRVHDAYAGKMPKRQSYFHHIEKLLGISAHKHLAETDAPTVEIDLEKRAIDSLTRAVSDYIALRGQDEPFVQAFLGWTWENCNGKDLMEQYKAVPEKMRPLK